MIAPLDTCKLSHNNVRYWFHQRTKFGESCITWHVIKHSALRKSITSTRECLTTGIFARIRRLRNKLPVYSKDIHPAVIQNCDDSVPHKTSFQLHLVMT